MRHDPLVMTILKTSPFALFVLAACSAPAQAMTGEELLALCGENPAQCEAYLQGLQDAGHAEMIYLRSGCSTSKCRVDTSDTGRGTLTGREWCLPAEVSPEDRRLPVLELLESDGYARFSPAAGSVASVWAETWPCED